MHRSKMNLAAACVVAMFALLGVTAIASAYESHGCPYEDACGWVNGSFGGEKHGWAGPVGNMVYFGAPECQTSTWNDCISSLTNHGATCNAYWFINAEYQGNHYTNNRETGTGTLTGGWNDEFSSLKWCEP